MSGRKVNGPMGGRKRGTYGLGKRMALQRAIVAHRGSDIRSPPIWFVAAAAFSSGIFVSARVITGGRKERAKDGRGGGEGAARPLPPAMAFKNTGKKPLGAAGTNPLLRGRAEKKDPPGHKPGGNLKRRCRVISLERDKPRRLYRAPLLIAAPWGYTPAGAPRFCRRDG